MGTYETSPPCNEYPFHKYVLDQGMTGCFPML
jgi:hypothetical protein